MHICTFQSPYPHLSRKPTCSPKYEIIRYYHLPEHHEILNHLFAEVVVDAVDLLFPEQVGQVVGQVIGGFQVTSKRFLHNQPRPFATEERMDDMFTGTGHKDYFIKQTDTLKYQLLWGYLACSHCFQGDPMPALSFPSQEMFINIMIIMSERADYAVVQA